MNIPTVVIPNVKGQVVIPLLMRKALDIQSNTPLAVSLVGNSISLTPVVDIVKKTDTERSYLQLLQKTQGAWAADELDADIKSVQKKQLELAASKRRKQTW